MFLKSVNSIAILVDKGNIQKREKKGLSRVWEKNKFPFPGVRL